MKVIELLNKTADYLNKEVIIVEKKNQTTVPKQAKLKKIKIDNEGRIQAPSTGNYCYTLSRIDKIIIDKINEIIDFVNKEEK